MDHSARIVVHGPDRQGETRALYAWLQREDELRGRLAIPPTAIDPERQGSVADVITATLGSAGVSTLARSLWLWLGQRRSDVVIEVTGPDGRSVRIDAKRVSNAESLIQQVLTAQGIIE